MPGSVCRHAPPLTGPTYGHWWVGSGGAPHAVSSRPSHRRAACSPRTLGSTCTVWKTCCRSMRWWKPTSPCRPSASRLLALLHRGSPPLEKVTAPPTPQPTRTLRVQLCRIPGPYLIPAPPCHVPAHSMFAPPCACPCHAPAPTSQPSREQLRAQLSLGWPHLQGAMPYLKPPCELLTPLRLCGGSLPGVSPALCLALTL